MEKQSILTELKEKSRWQSLILNTLIVVGVLVVVITLLNAIKIRGFATFTHPPTGIQIKFPNHWGFNDPKQPGAIIVFFAPPEGPLDTYTENIVLTYRELEDEYRTLKKLSPKMVLQVTRTFKGYMKVLKKEPCWVGRRRGYRFVYVGVVEGIDDPLKYMHVWTIVGNRVFIITYSARESTFDKYLKLVNKTISSFDTIKPKK